MQGTYLYTQLVVQLKYLLKPSWQFNKCKEFKLEINKQHKSSETVYCKLNRSLKTTELLKQ